MRCWTGIRSGLAAAALLVVASAPPGRAADDPFVHFINPITNPVNFEDARIESDVRPIYVYHTISSDFATQGGYVNIAALQLRLAVTERLAIIATKDGYVWVRPRTQIPTLVEDNSGFANIAFGAKYNFWKDPELGAMATAGLRYEAPSGEPQALQGPVFMNDAFGDRGAGIMNPFFSYLWGTENLHLLGYTAARLPLSNVDAMFFDMSLHADYRGPEITFAGHPIGRPYPTIEVNWIQNVKAGDRIPLDEESYDFFNLGSENAGGHGQVRMGFGGRWRFTDDLEVWGHRSGIDWGFAYELPLTSKEGIFDWRITTDLVFWVM